MFALRLIRPALKTLIILSLLGCCIAAITATASGAEPAKGHYLAPSGNTIKLQLNIASPAPQNLILEQYVPPGTQILNTSPKARKINSQAGVVKWLFKGVSPGITIVTMQVSPATATQDVNGILRYRIPGGGMSEQRIAR
jgi:hypothetical protein